MSKRSFVVNLVVWSAVLVACGAFIALNVDSALSHVSGGLGVSELEARLQTLAVFSAPAALYALGLAGVSGPERRSPEDDGDAGPVLPA